MDHPAVDAIKAAWEPLVSQPDAALSRVTASHYAGVVQLIHEKLIAGGIDPSSVRKNKALSLPASYGLNRPWDLVVAADDIPVAAIEIAIQNSVAGTKNFGNRISELLSMATDIDRQYEAIELRSYKPCLGLVFILEKTERTTMPLRRRPDLMILSAEIGPAASLQEQYETFFQRLLDDQRYDAICYLTATPMPDVEVFEPCENMGFVSFMETIVERATAVASLNKDLDLTPEKIGAILTLRDDFMRVMSGLTSTPAGLFAAEHAIIERRRQLVLELIVMSLDLQVNETKMQAAIGNNYWLFGGQYVGMADRRDLMPLDQHDIPLVCADGSLEIVELKGPESAVVKRHRNHLIVSSEVHEAVSQCISYLRTIDEMGAALRTTHRNEIGQDYDYRRARGVVVIGHPDRVNLSGVSRENVEQAIRSYNAHLSRVRVVTYADLLESAERALRFEGEASRDS